MSSQSSGEKREAVLPRATQSPVQVSAAPAVATVSQYQTLSKTLTRPINLTGGVLGSLPVSQPNISTMLPTALLGHNTDSSTVSTNSVVMTTSPAFSSSCVMTSTSPAVLQGSSIIQIGSTATLSIPAGTIPPNVSSLLKGSAPQTIQPSQGFPAHIPRGAVAAASALAGPKSSMTALPIVRHPVSIAQHTPSSGTLQSQLGHRASLITPVIRSNTPPTNPRSSSPAVTSTQTIEVQRGPLTIQSSVAQSSVGSIQITLPATRTVTDQTNKPLVTQHPKQIHQISTAQNILMTPRTPILQQTIAANLIKSGKGVVSSSILSSSTPTLSSALASSVTTAAPTIPIAKVPPVRQHQTASLPPHTAGATQQSHDIPRADTNIGQHLAPAPAHNQQSVFLSTLRTTPSTTMVAGSTPVTAVTTSAGHAEIRSERACLPMSFPSLPYLIPEYTMMYQQMAMIQQANQAAHSIPTISTASSTIRPAGLIPNQNPNLSASLQPAAHSLSVTSTAAVRLNPPYTNPMMVVENLRQQAALSVHTPFSTNSSLATSTEGIPRPTTPTDSLSSLSSVAMSSSAIPIPALSAMGIGNPTSYAATTPTTPQQGNHSTNTVVSTPSASPRPSILRKRPTNEGPVKKPVCGLNALLDRHSPRPDSRTDSAPQSNTSSPKNPHTPAGESQSSTDTALSSEATTPTQTSGGDIKIKQEPPDLLENGFSPSISQSLVSHTLPNSTEASPRKKPRKQLLNANEELKDTISSSEDDEDKLALDIKDECDIKQEYTGEYVDDDGVRWTIEKNRPNVSLLNFYNISWKSKNNHFQRYTDVKSKDERRPTVNELSNLRGVMQKASGWKLYHMAAQMEDLNELEKTLHSKLSAVQSSIAPHPPSRLNMMEDDLSMLHELTQANIQRCQLIMDQLQESRTNMLKVLDHKQKIIEIINKHMSKRPIKKKER